MEVRASNVFLFLSSPYCLRQALSLNQKLAVLARPAWQASEFLASASLFPPCLPSTMLGLYGFTAMLFSPQVFRDRVSPCQREPWLSWTHFRDQAGFELPEIHCASRVLSVIKGMHHHAQLEIFSIHFLHILFLFVCFLRQG